MSPYVGRPLSGGKQWQKLDTPTTSSNAFTMQVGGVAVTPAPEHVIIAVNGVIQEPDTGFTISGSTLTFTGTVVAQGTDKVWGMVAGDAAFAASSTINEDRLQISNAGSNGQYLQKQSANTGGLTWATVDTSTLLPLAGGTMTGNIVMADDTSIGISDSDERIEFDGAGDISLLGGNVGIGTTSPGGILSVGADNDTYFSAANPNTINFFYNEDADTGGWVNFRGYQAGTTQPRDFMVGDGQGNRIATFDGSTGRVGIGTASPATILDVSKTSAGGDVGITIHNTDNTTDSTDETCTLYGKMLSTATVAGKIVFARSGNYSGAGDNASKLLFYTADDNSDQLRMTISKGGDVGIGTPSDGSRLRVYGQANSKGMCQLMASSETGAGLTLAIWDDAGGNIDFSVARNGNVDVAGALSKGSGAFKIDHPLPSMKDTHHLVHSFTESPRADLFYRDKVTLVDGSAIINIDTVAGMTEGTFVLLCDNVQCFTSNESDWSAVKGSVSGNILTIECEDSSSTADVAWMVVGDRQDEHIMDTNWTDENGKPIIEPEKPIIEPEEEALENE